jgi:hypothetical protein
MPYRKGEGASFMVADFFSADFGRLRDRVGQHNAQATICPGKNRDGYFTAQEVCEQALKACQIVRGLWPDFNHVFIYDNATTHRKRADGSLSARRMSKFPSGTRGKANSNFLVETNRQDVDGNLIYDSRGNIVRDKLKMTGASFNGSPQNLYFPDDHSNHAGKFKGMKVILKERGLHRFANLPTECAGFKCAGISTNCCCHRVLYNQPDFSSVKSLLEDACSGYGVEVLFLPKFHCELNPIEMCWGCAKRLYRLKPESSKEEDLERNTLESLEAVPLLFMRRYVSCCSLLQARVDQLNPA